MARLFPLGIDNNNNRLINVGTPSQPTDAANKQYVDNLSASLSSKNPVVAAATGNVNLTAPGASFDGVTLNNGDRVLLMNQTDATTNGIYVWSGASSTLVRSTDANSASSLQGALVTINKGTVNANQMWYQTSDDIVLGTTSLVWARFSPGQALGGSNSILISGNAASVILTPSGGLTVSASGVAIDTTVAVRKVTGLLGNGSLTSLTVNHNLGTLDVHVSIKDATTLREVYPDVTVVDANNITVAFSTAPAANAYRFAVMG